MWNCEAIARLMPFAVRAVLGIGIEVVYEAGWKTVYNYQCVISEEENMCTQ
jgi:hypothetical protein